MKKLLVIGGAIVVILVVVLVVGVSNLGPIIKSAVNTYGPELTKTNVSLGDVDISIFSGEAELKDFHLGNPRGFKAPEAISVGSVYVDIDEGSLTGDTIIIDKIEVVAPEISYEKARGTDNFQTILNNVNKAVGADKSARSSAQGSEKESGGKKILIRNFIVRDGKVNLTMSMLGGKGISADLPNIHLKDIGRKQDGVAPATAFKEIFAALYGKITSPAVTDTLNQGLKALGSNVQALGESATKSLQTAGESTQKDLKKA